MPRTRLPFLHPRLLATASAQRGVFTAAQAYAEGHAPREVQRLRSDKHLLSVRRGVYALRAAFLGAPPLEQFGMRVAALSLALTAPGVLSHETAAIEHGLDLLDPDLSVLHVTRPVTSGTRREAGVHHHMAELAPGDRVALHPALLEATAPARTVLDLARETDRLECAVAAFDSALRAGVPLDDLRRELERARSWPGVRLASAGLALADGRAANPGESWSRVVLVQQGLAPLDLQVPLYDGAGLIGYTDFGWDGVVGEFDGKLKYGVDDRTDPLVAGRIVHAEKIREDRIRALGLEVARWGYPDLYRPDVVGARVRAAMARAATPRAAMAPRLRGAAS